MPFPAITPTMPALLRSAAARFGDKPFVVIDGETLTYADAERRSGDLARSLMAEGITKGDHVGILMPNSVHWVIAWFATTRIGAVAVPLNTFFKEKELAWVARHADLRAILCQPNFRGHDLQSRLEAALPTLDSQTAGRIAVRTAPFLRTIAVWGATDRNWATLVAADITHAPALNADLLVDVESCVTPADEITIIYTSGSTGDPKGAVHSHGALVRHTYNLTSLYVVHPDDVLFTSMPFFWVGGLITGLHAVLHHGATLISQPAFDAGDALRLIEEHRATITLGWPQQGKTLAGHPDFGTRDLTSVKRTSMPAMVPPDRRPVGCDSLGMTELCGNHLGVDPYVEQPDERRHSVGPSIDGLEHRIVDPATRLTVTNGEVGEIWARGYSLMQRLHKREREEVFTVDGFYRTGDCGFASEDGWVTFTGRLGDLIKTGGGTNVTPAEVESALIACDGVLEAYVVGIPDNDDDIVVAAAVVAHQGVNVDAATLRTEVRMRLSAYKVPRFIAVVDKNRLPFTDTGKMRKRELAEMLTRMYGRDGGFDPT
jgi:acyl-CoA synthetase (AMP-forming)/AMP-acid ligase II